MANFGRIFICQARFSHLFSLAQAGSRECRTDLCEKWDEALSALVEQKLWAHVGTSEGFDYLPANPEYGHNILVKVFIYKVLQ